MHLMDNNTASDQTTGCKQRQKPSIFTIYNTHSKKDIISIYICKVKKETEEIIIQLHRARSRN